METTTKTRQKVNVVNGIVMMVWTGAAVLLVTGFMLSIIASLFKLIT